MNEVSARRLFIGIPLDVACQQQLDISLQALQGDRHIRWVPYANRHLTLAFLGNTPAAVLHELQLQFRHAWPGNRVFRFTLNQLARFPDEQGSILAAVNEPSGPLVVLHAQALALVTKCGLQVAGRPFRPHITLGRMRHGNCVLQGLPKSLVLPLQVERVCLYESLPTADGRLYKVLNEACWRKN